MFPKKAVIQWFLGKFIVLIMGVGLSSNSTKFPHVYQALLQLGSCFDFPFESITINKNLCCLPHLDKNNVGDSIIVSLGNFRGGEIGVAVQPKAAAGLPMKFQINRRPLLFNGSKLVHWTEPFEGERYSIVFFNMKQKKK
jgi:hypothetical protein